MSVGASNVRWGDTETKICFSWKVKIAFSGPRRTTLVDYVPWAFSSASHSQWHTHTVSAFPATYLDLDDTGRTESEWRQDRGLLKPNKNKKVSDVPPTSHRVGTADIPSTNCARSLGFMISDVVTLAKYISYVCCSSYVEIRRISCVRQDLTVEAKWLCPPVPDCWSSAVRSVRQYLTWSNPNSRLCLCSVKVRLLYVSSLWLPSLQSP